MGGAQGGAGGFMHPAFGGAGGANGFGGFINDPTAQMGLQMGQGALKVGQEYMEQNVSSCDLIVEQLGGWPVSSIMFWPYEAG